MEGHVERDSRTFLCLQEQDQGLLKGHYGEALGAQTSPRLQSVSKDIVGT